MVRDRGLKKWQPASFVTDIHNHELPVKLSVWEDGHIKTYQGIIHFVDYSNQYIVIQVGQEHLSLKISDITGAEMI
jgi:expansin (peptidoglycan-binding protein)